MNECYLFVDSKIVPELSVIHGFNKSQTEKIVRYAKCIAVLCNTLTFILFISDMLVFSIYSIVDFIFYF